MAKAGGAKPALMPLPCPPEHELYRIKSRSHYDRAKRTASKIEADVVQRMNAVCDLLTSGPLHAKDLQELIGCTWHQIQWATKRLHRMGRIALTADRGWKLAP